MAFPGLVGCSSQLWFGWPVVLGLPAPTVGAAARARATAAPRMAIGLFTLGLLLVMPVFSLGTGIARGRFASLPLALTQRHRYWRPSRQRKDKALRPSEERERIDDP